MSAAYAASLRRPARGAAARRGGGAGPARGFRRGGGAGPARRLAAAGLIGQEGDEAVQVVLGLFVTPGDAQEH